jgi:hypothetical protein
VAAAWTSGRIDFSRIGLVGHSLGSYEQANPRTTTWSWPVRAHFARTDLNHRFAGSVFTYSAAFLDHHSRVSGVRGPDATAQGCVTPALRLRARAARRSENVSYL